MGLYYGVKERHYMIESLQYKNKTFKMNNWQDYLCNKVIKRLGIVFEEQNRNEKVERLL